MKLQIIDPCSEDWSKMTPTEKGKFCTACEKTVVDFSILSDTEVYHTLANHKGKICGRLSKQQILNYNKSQAFPTPSNIRKWSIAAALASVLVYPNMAQNNFPQEPLAMVFSLDTDNSAQEETQVHTNPAKDSVVISGIVRDATTGSLFNGVIIQVQGTELTTVSDEQGNFKIKVPKSKQKIAIMASYYGQYHPHTIHLKPSKHRNVHFKLKLAPHVDMIMGKIDLSH